MNADDVRDALRRQPRPELSPFFAARVTSRATARERERKRVPKLLVVYWVLFAIFAASLLLQTPIGVLLAIVALWSAAAALPLRRTPN